MKTNFTAFLIITAIITSCQACCTWNVVLTQPSRNDTCSCTLIQLTEIQQMSTTSSDYCHTIKIVFQSGIHQALGYEPLQVISSFKNLDRVDFIGELNVTLKCSYNYYFKFVNVSSMNVHGINFENCDYLSEYTLTSCGKTEIINSSFTNSRMQIFAYSGNILLSVKYVIFQNCHTRANYSGILKSEDNPILALLSRKNSETTTKLTLQGITVQNNSAKFMNINTSNVQLTLTGHNYFTNNTRNAVDLDCSCRSISCNGSYELQFLNTCVYFTNNTITDVDHQAVISLINAMALFEHSYVEFNNNHACEMCTSSAIEMRKSKAILNDNTTLKFSNNIGTIGGAIFLDSDSNITFHALRSSILLFFINNSALKGGAIYALDDLFDDPLLWHLPLIMAFKLFIHADIKLNVKSFFIFQCNTSLVRLSFKDNIALQGGSHIYGGWVDWLENDGITTYSPDTIEEISTFKGSSISDIASNPIRICLCENKRPNCNIAHHSTEIYGYLVHLDLMAVGQRYTPIQAYVRAIINSSEESIQIQPSVELLHDFCTTVSYKLYSDEQTLTLRPYSRYNKIYEINDLNALQLDFQLFHVVSIQVKVNQCPLGFELHKTDRNCVCQTLLSNHGLTCEPVSTTIQRKGQQWVGITNIHTISQDRIIVHQHCPFDYCRTDNKSLLFHLEDEDEICAFNRSGILCGGCKINFSRVLGSSSCKICTDNIFLLAVILLWLLLGIALVIFLMILNFTVSTGAINGLIFYANIINIQHSVFFTPSTSSSFLRMFISLLNIDHVVEICFYNGLDTYVIAWLQLFFPLYIWMLTAAMIISSHYSIRISRLIGNNAVPVLATLFLLSYTKLLQLIINVISFTTITYPDGYKSTVWLLDGNVQYLGEKHRLLFLTILPLLLFSLPYTLILLTVQVLSKISQYRFMFWVNKFKPLLDAYTGPYTTKHRYWTGLLLIVRIILLTAFSLNRNNNPTFNLVAIAVASTILIIWLILIGRIYNSFLNNYLELFFLSNLLFTSIAVLFESSYNSYSPAIAYTSTGISFVIFIGLIIYHAQRCQFFTKAGKILRVRHQGKRLVSLILCSVKKPSPNATCNALNQPLMKN